LNNLLKQAHKLNWIDQPRGIKSLFNVHTSDSLGIEAVHHVENGGDIRGGTRERTRKSSKVDQFMVTEVDQKHFSNWYYNDKP